MELSHELISVDLHINYKKICDFGKEIQSPKLKTIYTRGGKLILN